MKTIQFIAILLFATTFVQAQDINENQVPSVVLNTFKTEFPKASDVEWEMKGDQFQVEFEIGYFSDYEAWFKATGEMLYYEEEISKRKLPEAVKNTVQQKYDAYKIDDVKKINKKGEISYAIELEKGREEINIIINENGQIK